MLANGLWPYLKQRPLDKIANPAVTPKAIFISSFDSSPLAPDYDFIIHGQDQYFQHGLNALVKLTDGKVNLTLNEKGGQDEAFVNVKNLQINRTTRKHPAGNVTTQIHHFDSIDKVEFV